MITRESQLLINFLNIRVIVNGKDIYTLPPDMPVIIPLSEKKVKLVATDGFHITKPLELNYHPSLVKLYYSCIVDFYRTLIWINSFLLI